MRQTSTNVRMPSLTIFYSSQIQYFLVFQQDFSDRSGSKTVAALKKTFLALLKKLYFRSSSSVVFRLFLIQYSEVLREIVGGGGGK